MTAMEDQLSSLTTIIIHCTTVSKEGRKGGGESLLIPWVGGTVSNWLKSDF